MQIIPLAGRGRRFSEKGYTISKYLLPVQETPIIQHILSYLDIKRPTLIILNELDGNVQRLIEILDELHFLDYEIIEIASTSGQLESVMNGIAASRFRDLDGPLWIYNGDTIRKLPMPYDFFENYSHDSFIEVFVEEGNHWSFVDSLGLVSAITEKRRISEYCSTGLYGFKSLSRVKEVYYNSNLDKFHNELYVSSLFKKFLESDLSVFSFVTDRKEFILCGTPEEYERIEE